MIFNLLNEMAFDRSKALNTLRSKSDTFVDHVVKCVVYGDDLSDLNHWIFELSIILEYANNLEIKPHGKKLKESDIRNSLFGGFPENISDAREILLLFYSTYVRRGGKYPKFEYGDIDLVIKFFSVLTNIKDTFVPLLSINNTLNRNDLNDILRNIFKKYSIV